MKLVALYKTWDGGEFVDASLASIYDYVDSIVMVHSEISWLGERGNTVRPLALAWCEQHDKAGKVHHLNVEESNQEAQYSKGVDYIRHHDLGDVTMVVDADEVWDDKSIENAKRQIHDRPFVAFRSNMRTFLKTPFYEVNPPYGSPTVFLTYPELLTQSPRGSRAPARQLSDCWFSHYTAVRASREDVERKIRQSCLADKSNERVVPSWMERVYDQLPEGENLHYFQKWREVWKRINKIWLSDLPPAMRQAKLMRLWLPEGHFLDGELNAIHRLASGREQAVDLGTYKGLSAVALSLCCRRVHTVDCYENLPADSFADTLEPDRYRKMQDHSLQANYELASRFGNITLEPGDSAEAGRLWNRGPVDVLLVDADHSYEGTVANVEAWWPHLRDGARIIFHDDNAIHPGVQRAISEFRLHPRMRFFDPGEHSGSLAVCEVA